MLVRQVLDDVVVKDLGGQLIRGLRTDPLQDRLTRCRQVGHVVGMKLKQPELAFGEKDARLHVRRRLQRQIGDPVDAERGRHLDDQRVLPAKRRIGPRARRRRQVGRELRLQILDRQIDAKLGHALVTLSCARTVITLRRRP